MQLLKRLFHVHLMWSWHLWYIPFNTFHLFCGILIHNIQFETPSNPHDWKVTNQQWNHDACAAPFFLFSQYIHVWMRMISPITQTFFSLPDEGTRGNQRKTLGVNLPNFSQILQQNFDGRTISKGMMMTGGSWTCLSMWWKRRKTHFERVSPIMKINGSKKRGLCWFVRGQSKFKKLWEELAVARIRLTSLWLIYTINRSWAGDTDGSIATTWQGFPILFLLLKFFGKHISSFKAASHKKVFPVVEGDSNVSLSSNWECV